MNTRERRPRRGRLGLQGKTLALFLAVALVPLGVALLLVDQITQAQVRVARGETDRLREPLGKASSVYKEAARARKDAFRAHAALQAARPDWPGLCAARDAASVGARLDALLGEEPELARARLDVDGQTLAERKRPLASASRTLELETAVAGAPGCSLHFTFATSAALQDELQAIGRMLAEQRYLDRVRGTLPSSYWWAFALLFGGVVAAVTLLAVVVARATNRRLLRLAAATTRVAEGDLDARVDEPGRDELADLAHAFNAMVEELRHSRAEIEYLQKIGAWQEVARRLAHEIKNPLTPIQLAVQQLESSYAGGDERFRRMLGDAREIVTEEVAGLRRLVDAFSSFAKLPRVETKPLDLGVVVDDVARETSIDIDPPPSPVTVAGDRLLLRRALRNLVDNAHEAGARAVRISWRERASEAQVTVDDDGPGVSPLLAAKIFDPYVTGKEHGTGLGLAIVKKTLLEHGGDIVLVPTPGPLGGARFELTLPLSSGGPG
jgi:nitrogen fixation/metabolism regulation signal transduction histidine kinase